MFGVFKKASSQDKQAQSRCLESQLGRAGVVNAMSRLGVNTCVQECRRLPCTAPGSQALEGAGTPRRRLCTEQALFPLVVREVAPWLGALVGDGLQ